MLKKLLVLLQIAPPFDVEHLQRLYPATYQESMNTVLVQEALRYNALLEVVAASLKECIKAVKGLVVMSPSLESVCNSMYDNQVNNPDWACQHICRAAEVSSCASFMQSLGTSTSSRPSQLSCQNAHAQDLSSLHSFAPSVHQQRHQSVFKTCVSVCKPDKQRCGCVCQTSQVML